MLGMLLGALGGGATALGMGSLGAGLSAAGSAIGGAGLPGFGNFGIPGMGGQTAPVPGAATSLPIPTQSPMQIGSGLQTGEINPISLLQSMLPEKKNEDGKSTGIQPPTAASIPVTQPNPQIDVTSLLNILNGRSTLGS